MSSSYPIMDRLYGPFERALKPLDLPIAPIASDASAMRIVLHFARMFRKHLATLSCFTVLSGLINLGLVWGIAFIVDGVSKLGVEVFLDQYMLLLLGFAVFIGVIDPVLSFCAAAHLRLTVGVSLPAAMRWQSHSVVESQDIAFFEDRFPGQVASRLEQVTAAARSLMLAAARSIPELTLQFAGYAGLLAALAPALAVPVVVWILLNLIVSYFALPTYVALTKRVAAATSLVTGAMTDIYSNIRSVKLFSTQRSEGAMIKRAIADTVTRQHAESRVFVTTNTIIHLLNAALWISMAATGLWGLNQEFVSLGGFVAAMTIVRALSVSSRAWLTLGQTISQGLGIVSDAKSILASKPTIVDVPDARELAISGGDIVFDNVSFGYASEAPVIKDLSLRIAQGEHIGLVGMSGAGKSTLVSLLLRLRDVDGGSIRINGTDIREVTQDSLTNQISVVTQDIDLMHRSIRENLRYGNALATDTQIMDMLEQVQMADTVRAMRDGHGRVALDAHVGDRGVKLSGGQRQRIAIARALLKNAPIVVFDEATSAMDSQTEAQILQAFDRTLADRTVIKIAHRLSTISDMDRIIVLGHGSILEDGTHTQLTHAGGLYQRLWTTQFSGSGGARVVNH